MKIVERPKYLYQLISVIGTPDIKVITGIRRSGKSELLKSFIKYINNKIGDRANIIHIDYNLKSTQPLLDSDALYDHIEKEYKEDKQNFVLIDEVQMCPNFEKAINYLHALQKYDIYITGSNAFLLSSDLATLFTGRTYGIEVYPFSFKEYLSYFRQDNLEEAFNKYVLEGGMAGTFLYDNLKEKYKYLENVYDTLIARDINTRYEIRNKTLLEDVSNFLMDNISNQTSARNIANMTSPNHTETRDKTISNYIQHLIEAFAFYRVRRYDIRGKKYLASQDKYYLADHAFRFAKLGTKNIDWGRIYENIVAIELLRRGYDIYVGTLYNKEIDFVAIKRNEVIYIQVSDDIANPETLDREMGSLLNIKDAYPKIIIANTKHDNYTKDGVKIIDLAHWLAN